MHVCAMTFDDLALDCFAFLHGRGRNPVASVAVAQGSFLRSAK